MNLVVIGAQWGDEGKGKIVDFLAPDADLVIRFSGGANAGHTIVTEDKTYKLHLIPSGIIYPEKTVILGTGMVIDPEALFKELDTLTEQGINWEGRVLISDRAHIVFPEYKKEDISRENTRVIPIGTTGRGIGVTYSHKAFRDGIRIVDIFDETVYKNLHKQDAEFLKSFKDKINPMVIDLSAHLSKKPDKNVLYEGAQGILLDLDIGTYPFVSSGCASAAGAATGGGIGPGDIDRVLGVFKAYSTRVGNGPFPSEFKDKRDGDLEHTIRETGREYGVTTGRPRRCGYLDLTALRYACRTNSLDSLVLTHLDVYDEMDEIKVCTSYDFKGKNIVDFPSSLDILNNSTPVLKTFKGWKRSIKDCKSFNELPEQARQYINYIEQFTETNIDIVSVGYKREQTIVRKEIWTKS